MRWRDPFTFTILSVVVGSSKRALQALSCLRSEQSSAQAEPFHNFGNENASHGCPMMCLVCQTSSIGIAWISVQNAHECCVLATQLVVRALCFRLETYVFLANSISVISYFRLNIYIVLANSISRINYFVWATDPKNRRRRRHAREGDRP